MLDIADAIQLFGTHRTTRESAKAFASQTTGAHQNRRLTSKKQALQLMPGDGPHGYRPTCPNAGEADKVLSHADVRARRKTMALDMTKKEGMQGMQVC